MALKTDKAVEVFSAKALNKINDKEIELIEAREAIKELAKNPNPNNRYEIAQILGYTVDTIIRENSNFIEMFADVRNVGYNEKVMFTIELDGIQAFIQAKGATTQRSRVYEKHVTLETEAVSTRPVINYLDLASGKINFDKLANDAANKMQIAILGRIETVLYNAFSTYSSPNYASGSGVVKATLDAQLNVFNRLGNVSIIGDIDMISQLTELAGFTVATGTIALPDAMIIEHNNNGYLGRYNGANVVKLVNPLKKGDITKNVLRKDVMYIVPSGLAEMRPLKVLWEGDMTVMEQTNINDLSYEMRMDKLFGAGIVYAENYMGMYEDTSL